MLDMAPAFSVNELSLLQRTHLPRSLSQRVSEHFIPCQPPFLSSGYPSSSPPASPPHPSPCQSPSLPSASPIPSHPSLPALLAPASAFTPPPPVCPGRSPRSRTLPAAAPPRGTPGHPPPAAARPAGGEARLQHPARGHLSLQLPPPGASSALAFRSALPCQPRCPPSEFLPGGPALPSPASISSIHLPSLPPPAWRERMAEREKGATSPAGSSPFLGLHLASPPNFRYRSLPPPQTPQALSRGRGGGSLQIALALPLPPPIPVLQSRAGHRLLLHPLLPPLAGYFPPRLGTRRRCPLPTEAGRGKG